MGTFNAWKELTTKSSYSQKGKKEDHMKKVEEVLRTVKEAGIRLKLKKSEFAQTSTEWLGFILLEEGIRPIEEKIQALTEN